MKKLLLSGAIMLCAVFVSSAITAQDAPQPGETLVGNMPSSITTRSLDGTPVKVLIRKDDTVKPGEVAVTSGDEGVRIIRVHPDTPLEKVRQKMQELQGQNVPALPADRNVLFSVSEARPGVTQLTARAVPVTAAAVRPPVDPDFVQLLQARLQHATRVLRYKQAGHDAGTGNATDADLSAAELAVKEAQFALKKATQPWPMMMPQMMPAPQANREAAALRKAYIEQLATQFLELQQEFVEVDTVFKSGGEEDADAVSWLRAKIMYLDAAARFYREAGVPDRLMESQRDRAKAVQMLVRVLEEKSKQDGIGEEDRREFQKQLQNARIIAAEAGD